MASNYKVSVPPPTSKRQPVPAGGASSIIESGLKGGEGPFPTDVGAGLIGPAPESKAVHPAKKSY